MKTILLALMFLGFARNVLADTLSIPDGCYVQYGHVDRCFEFPVGTTISWIESSDQSALYANYGQILATVIASGFQRGEQLNSCIDDYNGLVTQYNAALAKIAKLKKQIRKLKARK